MMDEDRSVEDVLDKFVSCHEQTYEEFLSTFTHLLKEDIVAKGGTTGTIYSENKLTSTKSTHENEHSDQYVRKTPIFLDTSSQCSEEEQIMLDEGQKVGSSLQGDLNRAGKIMVDNFLVLEDLEMDEEIKPQMSQDLMLLPGEVEQDLCMSMPSYTPSTTWPPAPGIKPQPTVRSAHQQMEEVLGDEVQPFSLDEEFDYDNVVLTPKYTPEELQAIQELSKQKRENVNTDLETLHDSFTKTS